MQGLSDRFEIGRKMIKVLDVGAPRRVKSMTPLIVGEAGDPMVGQ